MKKVRTTRALAGLIALAAVAGCTTIAGVDETYVLRDERFCEPAKAQPCYSGPEGTEGKGQCKAGVQVCDDDGEAFGPCVGEVLPSLESCTTIDVDESCEGEPLCVGAHLWSKSLSGGFLYGSDVAAIDKEGNLILPGSFSADIDFGSGPINAVGMDDIYLAKFDPQGNLLWVKSFGGPGNDHLGDVAVDIDGSILITGSFDSDIDFGDGPMQSAGAADIFIARLDADGNLVWAKQFGDADDQFGEEIELDPLGKLVVAGSFGGSLDFGSEPLISAGNELFLATLDPYGGYVWAKHFGTSGTDARVQAMALDGAGDILMTGAFVGDLSFGGAPLSNLDKYSMWIAKLDPAGEYLWDMQYGDTELQYGKNIAADSAGNVVATGTFKGSTDFGGGPILSVGDYDVAVVKLAPDGSFLWAQTFGGSDWDEVYGMAIDGGDNILITGDFYGTIAIDGNELNATGTGDDIYVAKLDPSGAAYWTKRFGDGDAQAGNAIAVDSIGNSILVAGVSGTVNFGGGAIGAVDSDVMLAKFGP